MTDAYPLQWPENKARTPDHKRERARFGAQTKTEHKWSDGRTTTWLGRRQLTVSDALARLREELKRLGATYPVISTNVPLRNDGLPRSGAKEPDDPGVAVYFQLDDVNHCMPCDKWGRVADNLAAVAKHIEALRAITRYGVQDTNEAFSGFLALPSHAARGWWAVLGVPVNAPPDQVDAAYVRERAKAHPDRGGSSERFIEVQNAYKQYLEQTTPRKEQ